MTHKNLRALLGASSFALLAACGGGNGGSTGSYAIGGGVYGLKGSGLVLQLNAGNDLVVNQSGSFAFPAQTDGSAYTVTVKTQPTGTTAQTCAVVNGNGKLGGKAVSTIEVNCSPWTQLLGGGGNTDALGTTVDAAGNLYVVGYTNVGLDGNTQSGDYDGFLTKYDRYGARIYTRQWGGTTGTYTYAYGVAVDSSGNACVTGSTTGSLDGNTRTGTEDTFLARFDAAGNRQMTQWGSAGSYTDGFGITADGNGNVYVTGTTLGGLDGNKQTGVQDVFLAIFDAAGKRQIWQWGGPGDAIGQSVAVDASGTVYVAGWTDSALSGGTQNGSFDAFLTRFNTSTGTAENWQWGAASASTNGFGVALDGNGKVYVTGSTDGALGANTRSGMADAFIATFDTNANSWQFMQWGAKGAYSTANGIVVDSSGNLYVVGNTNGSLDGASLTGTVDSFLTEYNTAGDRITWQAGVAGVASGGSAIALDGVGHIYVAGDTDGALDGNTLSGAGATDMMVMKYAMDGTRL